MIKPLFMFFNVDNAAMVVERDCQFKVDLFKPDSVFPRYHKNHVVT